MILKYPIHDGDFVTLRRHTYNNNSLFVLCKKLLRDVQLCIVKIQKWLTIRYLYNVGTILVFYKGACSRIPTIWQNGIRVHPTDTLFDWNHFHFTRPWLQSVILITTMTCRCGVPCSEGARRGSPRCWWAATPGLPSGGPRTPRPPSDNSSQPVWPSQS